MKWQKIPIWHILLVLVSPVLAQVPDPAGLVVLEPLYHQYADRIQSAFGQDHLQAADALGVLARFLEHKGDAAAAIQALHRSVEIRDKHTADERLAADLEALAALQPSSAASLLVRAIQIREDAGKGGAELALAHTRLGDVLAGSGDPAEAMKHYRTSVQGFEKAIANKTVPAGDLRFALALVNLGFALEQEQKFAAAEGSYRRALAIQEKGLGPRHPEVGVTLNNLAGVLGALGRFAQAEQVYRRAMGLFESTLGPRNPRLALCASNFADMLAAQKRTAEATALLERALAIYEALGDAQGAAQSRESLSALRPGR